MTNNKNDAGPNPQLEQKLVAYYSLYRAEPAYKSSLKQKLAKSSPQSIAQAGRRENRFFEYLHYRPAYKWLAALAVVILIFIMLIAIRPVRAAIERLIDFGYLEGAGFVRVSETYVLPGPVYSKRPEQTIAVDRVIANPQKTVVWLRVIGDLYTPEEMNARFFATMAVDRQTLPFFSSSVLYSPDEHLEKGVYEFTYLGLGIPSQFVLHLSPDWNIPISLVPMASMDTTQTTTLYPDLCQTHLDVELCLRTFVSDSTGYHLWLSASSRNPIYYLQYLNLNNPLSAEGPTLTDSSGHPLAAVYSSEPAIVMQVSPAITDTPGEESTYLSFERSPNEGGSLELQVPGLTGKTPANNTILCSLGNDPQVGNHFACEKTITIAGEQIRFHEGVISQHSNGIHLTIVSDPIEASNGFQITMVDAESLYYENSSLVGVGFDMRTHQLEIWLGMDSLNAKNQFAVKITSADLTILEPFNLSWKINP